MFPAGLLLLCVPGGASAAISVFLVGFCCYRWVPSGAPDAIDVCSRRGSCCYRCVFLVELLLLSASSWRVSCCCLAGLLLLSLCARRGSCCYRCVPGGASSAIGVFLVGLLLLSVCAWQSSCCYRCVPSGVPAAIGVFPVGLLLLSFQVPVSSSSSKVNRLAWSRWLFFFQDHDGTHAIRVERMDLEFLRQRGQ